MPLALASLAGTSGAQRESRTGPSRQTQPLVNDVKKNGAAENEQAENPQAWFDLGFAQNHLNKTSEAVASYRKAVQLSPKWFEANLNLGVALAKLNDFSAATPVLQHAVTLKPTTGGNKALSKAWQTLGQVLETTDAKAAAAAYDKAVELDPSQTSLTLDAGRILQASNDLRGAEEHFKKSADAGDAQGMVLLINLLNQQKRHLEAETWLTKYVEKNFSPPREKRRKRLPCCNPPLLKQVTGKIQPHLPAILKSIANSPNSICRQSNTRKPSRSFDTWPRATLPTRICILDWA